MRQLKDYSYTYDQDFSNYDAHQHAFNRMALDTTLYEALVFEELIVGDVIMTNVYYWLGNTHVGFKKEFS